MSNSPDTSPKLSRHNKLTVSIAAGATALIAGGGALALTHGEKEHAPKLATPVTTEATPSAKPSLVNVAPNPDQSPTSIGYSPSPYPTPNHATPIKPVATLTKTRETKPPATVAPSNPPASHPEVYPTAEATPLSAENGLRILTNPKVGDTITTPLLNEDHILNFSSQEQVYDGPSKTGTPHTLTNARPIKTSVIENQGVTYLCFIDGSSVSCVDEKSPGIQIYDQTNNTYKDYVPGHYNTVTIDYVDDVTKLAFDKDPASAFANSQGYTQVSSLTAED